MNAPTDGPGKPATAPRTGIGCPQSIRQLTLLGGRKQLIWVLPGAQPQQEPCRRQQTQRFGAAGVIGCWPKAGRVTLISSTNAPVAGRITSCGPPRAPVQSRMTSRQGVKLVDSRQPVQRGRVM